jgi:hypothetical protein
MELKMECIKDPNFDVGMEVGKGMSELQDGD